MLNLKKIQLKQLDASLALRIGLGLAFLYAATHILLDPQGWIGYVPQWIGGFVSAQTFLSVYAVFELLLGLTILIGWWLPASSLVAFLNLLSILVFYGVDDVTFRDFGLLMAALALFLLTIRKEVK